MLNLVVALATESRPLIDHFNLKEDTSVVGFRVFSNESMRLIVTGLGRVSCAAGVATLGARETERGVSAWLNIGIAGHATRSLGTGVHAVSIFESATGRRWYPVQIHRLPGDGEDFCTVDVPETAYPESYVYDMEASAFYATALRYTSSELIQVYRIISDNRENGVKTVNKHAIRDFVTQHLPVIDKISADLSGLAGEIDTMRPKLPEVERIMSRWHFTVSQQHQLRGLMRKWNTLFGDEPMLDAALNRCPSAKSVLAEISVRLNAVYER